MLVRALSIFPTMFSVFSGTIPQFNPHGISSDALDKDWSTTLYDEKGLKLEDFLAGTTRLKHVNIDPNS